MQADGQTLVTYTGMTRIVIFLQVNYTDLSRPSLVTFYVYFICIHVCCSYILVVTGYQFYIELSDLL